MEENQENPTNEASQAVEEKSNQDKSKQKTTPHGVMRAVFFGIGVSVILIAVAVFWYVFNN